MNTGPASEDTAPPHPQLSAAVRVPGVVMEPQAWMGVEDTGHLGELLHLLLDNNHAFR